MKSISRGAEALQASLRAPGSWLPEAFKPEGNLRLVSQVPLQPFGPGTLCGSGGSGGFGGSQMFLRETFHFPQWKQFNL